MEDGDIEMTIRDRVLKIHMLGGFSMYYGDEALTLNKAGTSKSVRLLQMLLLSLQSGIPKGELIDNLYGWNEKNEMGNRNKNLNNLIYRLKGQLVSCGLPDDEYVEIREGICYFRGIVPIELDIQQFEQKVRAAEEEKDPIKRIRLLTEANEMYRGELLPVNLSDMWFFEKSNYYKELYLRTVQKLEKEFCEKRDYKNLIQLYSRVTTIYPFENWQTKLIRCNLEIYRYDEALEIYNDTMELYTREMGTPPIAEMQECFEKVELLDEIHRRKLSSDNFRDMDKAFMDKKEDIKNVIFNEKNVQGAYYCTYPSFVDYCRLVVRAKGRNEFPAVMMFLTLSEKGNRGSQKQINLQEQMKLLKSVIGDSLRVGDAYTRYGNRHFILMLTKTEEDSCVDIFRRVEKAYVERSGKGNIWYYTDLTQKVDMASLGE